MPVFLTLVCPIPFSNPRHNYKTRKKTSSHLEINLIKVSIPENIHNPLHQKALEFDTKMVVIEGGGQFLTAIRKFQEVGGGGIAFHGGGVIQTISVLPNFYVPTLKFLCNSGHYLVISLHKTPCHDNYCSTNRHDITCELFVYMHK